MPSINGFNKVATNSDGSVDLWFGSSKPANARGGRNFLVALRLYGSGYLCSLTLVALYSSVDSHRARAEWFNTMPLHAPCRATVQ
jgi:hypothetical protein